MEDTRLALTLQNEMELSLKPGATTEEIRSALRSHINDLINHDFNRLVSLLYRIDVNEQKLKGLLAQSPGEDSAQLIADLILERQIEKIKSRKDHRTGEDACGDEERW